MSASEAPPQTKKVYGERGRRRKLDSSEAGQSVLRTLGQVAWRIGHQVIKCISNARVGHVAVQRVHCGAEPSRTVSAPLQPAGGSIYDTAFSL